MANEPREIRQATDHDIRYIIQLYADGSGRNLNHGRLAGYIDTLPSAVAFQGEQLAGFGFCIPFAPDIVELGNLFVSYSYRSLGIGTNLVDCIERQARKTFHSIVLSNSMHYQGVKEKQPATSFYLRNGYQHIWSTGPTNVFAKSLRPREAT